MKPKPKKRRGGKKKKKKSNSSQQDFLLNVGGKIIQHMAGDDVIYIRSNSAYYRKWGWISIGFGLLVVIMLNRAITSPFDSGVLIILVIPFLLFAGLGLSYFRKADNATVWTIDLTKREMKIDEFEPIPFSKIQCFSMSKLPTASPQYSNSYQLIVVQKNTREFLLITADDHNGVERVGRYFAVQTMIPFNEFIEWA